MNALTPEANAPITRRSNVKLERDDLFLVLTVSADDTVALRSTLNAYLRWINSIVNVIDLVESDSSGWSHYSVLFDLDDIVYEKLLNVDYSQDLKGNQNYLFEQ